MSTEPGDRSRDAVPASRRNGEPRSTLWRVAVGTTPVVATALTLEFGRTLVVDSFGETEVVQTLASTLRAFWILLVVGGVLFAGYRWYSQRQDGDRLAHELALLDSLDAPEVAVTGIPPHSVQFAPFTGPVRSRTGAAVLWRLPIRRYDSALLLTVAEALTEAAHSLDDSGAAAPPFRTATEFCDQLLHDGVLAVFGAQYYPTERRAPSGPDPVLTTPAWAAAIYALVREYADRASAHAVALGHPEHAVAARRWFGASVRDLYDLLTGCAGAPLRDHLPAAALPELVRILDALEVRYAGNPAFVRLCGRVEKIPKLATLFPVQHDLVRLRANLQINERTRFRPLSWSTGVAARSSHMRALRDLSHLRTESELDDVATELGRTWRLLPRADLHAEVCVLINLAVVELRRGNLDAAGDRLDLALARTESGRDPAGRVHATEISGVLHWMRGATPVALRDWLTAHTGYNALHDHRGAARCLRHLGAALAGGSKYGGIAIAPTSGAVLPHSEVVTVARHWRADADRLERDGPAAVLSVRRPRDVVDPHLSIRRGADSS